MPAPIELWDENNSRAVINIVSETLKERILSAKEKAPDLFGLDEKTLSRELRTRNEMPNTTDNRLRMMFWLEYDLAQAELRPMKVDNVVAGVCSRQYFESRYIRVTSKVAWLLTPPTDYVVLAREALHFGLEQLREVLDEPHRDPVTAKLDTKLIKLKLDIVQMLDIRVKGAPVQKLAVAHLGAHGAAAGAGQAKTMDDLQRRMKELEARERKILNIPDQTEDGEVIVVNSKPV